MSKRENVVIVHNVVIMVISDMVWGIANTCTVEPLIKDPTRGGHNRNNLSTKDTYSSSKSQIFISPYC